MARSLLVLLASLVIAVGSTSGEPPKPSPPPAFDRAAARSALLRRLHAQADEAAGLAHLAARLAANEAFPSAYLGVDADPDPAAGGMRIARVYPATSAQDAGLQPGEAILAVNDVPTPSVAALGGALRALEAGSLLHLRLRRGTEERTQSLVLGQRPEDNDDPEEDAPTDGAQPFGAEAAAEMSFDGQAADAPPAGLDLLLGGHGDAPQWRIVHEAGAVFLRQSAADRTGIRYPMAWARDFRARDVQARVRFRLVSGTQDRAAGLVVRGQDRWNYLVARVNGAEDDLCLFRCAHGRRQLLPGGRVPVDLKDGAWHVLEVRAQGARISATLDGANEVVAYDTYVRGWRAGLWTKSDAVTDFDDFTARGLPTAEAR